MIRTWHNQNLSPLINVWMESTRFAHPFIDARYWQESEAVVRDTYLPLAQTWVWEGNSGLDGFISVLDAQFIGALFVRPAMIGHGIGKALITHVKQRFNWLSLEVYQKNYRAVHFYHAQGFRIEESAWQHETQHPTWIMNWQADQML